ncbi:hypothetical protein [Nocardioides sp. SYSU D00038]|uniref:hypothetical protein n=1 Tax=Nocardioides sp. SYSU D00038 TaxID=2812554 RepID=UPI001967EBF8|nr:hypothetical protein [Nocardioides sp. SYSU D00038]
MAERFLAGAMVVPFVLAAVAAPTEERAVVTTFTDPAIDESSGLVVEDGLFVTTNDSGDEGRVFAVDPRTGDTVGVTRWADDPTDVEALAPAGPGEVWVADVGDNLERRDAVQLARVPVGEGDREVDPTVYDLVYPDGPHNAETLLAHPATGELLVVTKELFGGRVFAVPRRLDPDAPNRLVELGDALAWATDGAFLPDGRHLVLRDYVRARVYTFPGLEEVATVPLPPQQQGEGLAVDDTGRIFLSSEGHEAPVLRFRLPDDVRALLDPPPASPAAEPEPDPLPDPAPVVEEETLRPGWPWVVAGLVGLGALGAVLLGRRRRR